VVAGGLAVDLVDRPRLDALDALPDTLRVAGAAFVLFGMCGLGVVRLALPESLRAREALWVLPAGACTSALALTVLGFNLLGDWLRDLLDPIQRRSGA